MGLGKFTSTAGGKIKPTETNCKIAFCPAGFIHNFADQRICNVG